MDAIDQARKHILSELTEIDRRREQLVRALDALKPTRINRPAKAGERKKPHWSPKARAEAARRMKRYWAERKKAAAK